MRAKLIIGGSALVLLLILLISCHKSAPKPAAELTPPLGKNCTVQFRRDALGAASTNPVPPLTGSFNGAETAIGGKLKNVTSEWIVIERAGSELWIPRRSVLLLQF
jgi:hypothetical protein